MGLENDDAISFLGDLCIFSELLLLNFRSVQGGGPY